MDPGVVDGVEGWGAVEASDRLVEEAGTPGTVLIVQQFESGIVTNEQSTESTENVR